MKRIPKVGEYYHPEPRKTPTFWGCILYSLEVVGLVALAAFAVWASVEWGLA